ncbi:hypothetical protein CHS0354_018704 [Potamilus streckersoni]|uniref:Heat shock 70 kDa protein 12B n=1 Tax=Potamilus streckersoni TaxID=2493646 RepID=A0AAE0SKW6_9BIVA|nr:hypothetical protein CHS0354_018704 [Potamilus streckersoni]
MSFPITVAIDFGTTFSGFGFSLHSDFKNDPLKICTPSVWNAGNLLSLKTPTCVLLQPDKTFSHFGYEAEDKYKELAEQKKHKDWYYFRRFKMILHNTQGLRRETIIEDEFGKPLQAKEVFAHGIRYLKNHALDLMNLQGKHMDESEISWVLTVPAIWSDGAKQFMREAAQSCGIENHQLSIALEPEAAALYCKYLPMDKLTGSDDSGLSVFSEGTKYMIIDLGGGTADITVHEVESKTAVRELHKPSGGAWGGVKVDEAFLGLLKDLAGENVVRQFTEECTEDFLDLFREFEFVKRQIKLDMTDKPKVRVKIPVSFYDIFKNQRNKSLKESLAQTGQYAGKIECLADKLIIDAEVMKSLFKKNIDNIVEHIQDVLGELPVRGTKILFLVGGFSESLIVQESIRRRFSNMKVIVPFDAGLAVLKGAVIYGHKPLSIASRMCRLTYGIAVSKLFQAGQPEEKKYTDSQGRVLVKDVFHKYVEMDTPVKVGDFQTSVALSASKDQGVGRIRVYSSNKKSPNFVTDKGCTLLGEILIELEEEDEGGRYDVKMAFGGTEIIVEATEQTTKKTQRATFDFLID